MAASSFRAPKITGNGEPVVDDLLLALLQRAGAGDAEERKCGLPTWDGGPMDEGRIYCAGVNHYRGPSPGAFEGLCSTNTKSVAATKLAAEEARLACVLERIARLNGEGSGFEHTPMARNEHEHLALKSFREFSRSAASRPGARRGATCSSWGRRGWPSRT